MNKLNKEEFIVGTVVALTATFWTGWFSIPLALVAGFFWALSGAGESKLFRRLGVPAIIVVQIALKTQFWWCMLSIPAAWGVLTIGYGTPEGDDNPSFLGEFFWKLTGAKQPLTDILTRGVIVGLLYLVIGVPFILRTLFHIQ